MKRALTKLSSLMVMLVIVIGAVLACLEMDIYWMAIAAWAMILAFLRSPFFRSIDRPSIPWMVPLITLPYLVSYSAYLADPRIDTMTSVMHWPLVSMGLFAISLETVRYFDSGTGLKMNLSLMLFTTFLLYESLVILQGPVVFYSGILLGTEPIPGITELMSYTVVATMNGIALTSIFSFLLKGSRLVEHVDDRAGSEGP